MDQSLLYMIGAGVLALVLIILILRFAMRPKKTAAPQQTGLGLPVNPGTSSGGAESKPLSSFTPSVAEMRAAEAAASSVAATSGPGVWSRDAASSSAGEGRNAPSATAAPVTAASSRPSFQQNGCPKCGGRFLDGELEGPTLMVDGVSREDFQPLLTARECSSCGFLELYTRPVSR